MISQDIYANEDEEYIEDEDNIIEDDEDIEIKWGGHNEFNFW